MSIKRLIENLPIEKYFTVTGGAIAPFVDAADDKVVFFQHEQAAVMAAEGYYRSCGKIAAVLVTSGPGIQNTLNGVCGCWYDSIPCLIISGQVNTSESIDSVSCKPRQIGFQEMPVIDIFQNCTVYCKKIQNPEEVYTVFSDALSACMNNRKGPSVIDFPVNIQMSEFDGKIIIKKNDIPSFNVPYIDFKKFKRPLIVVGNGARNCEIKIKEFKIPFVRTWAAKDILQDEEMNFGMLGVYGDRVANFAVQNADLLIILGSRFDTRQTGGKIKNCSPESFKIMVDIDKNELDKFDERGLHIDVKLFGTVENFVNNVKLDVMDITDWLNVLYELKNKIIDEKPGNVYTILENINIPDDAIVIPDCGGNLVWAMQTLKPKKIFTNLGNSSMGYSLPAAIGASIGTPGAPIICIIGDGGINMNIQELYTVKRLNLPITILVLNNSGYGIIRQFQNTYLNSRHIATNMTIDVGKISEAYGIKTFYSDTITVSRNEPVLYDIEIHSDQTIVPKLEFGNTLENMSPYIPFIKDYMYVEYNEFINNKQWRKI